MKTRVKVVHYLNQFFGGIGGEEKAYAEPIVCKGPVGPGRVIQKVLGDHGEVVATVICGDNTFSEDIEGTCEKVIRLLAPFHPDAMIAGPAFNAGRYGIACGAICHAVQQRLGIPAVTGMFDENPGLDLYRTDLYVVQTSDSVRGMNQVIPKMVSIALRLAYQEEIGSPTEEGYFSRGVLVNETIDQTGAERVITMLLRKIRGQVFHSEVTSPQYDRVNPAPRIDDMRAAKIALVTDGGLVPKGNPDKIEASTATRFGRYTIEGMNSLRSEEYEVNHVGYDSIFVRQDPNRLVPLDVMRTLEKEGAIGRLHDYFCSTAGVANIVEIVRKMGQAMAESFKREGVSGVILTST